MTTESVEQKSHFDFESCDLESRDLESINACEICSGTFFSVVAKSDRNGSPLQTVLCDQCGLVFTNPRPTAAANAQFYRETYRLEYKRTSQPSRQHLYRAGNIASERLGYIQAFLPERGIVLDVGSGGGELLFMLRSRGYAVQGIEPNIGYAEFARSALGLPIMTSAYQDAEISKESIDFVTSFHVFEHLDHPLDALRHLTSWVKPGGGIFLEVPNVLSSCQWPSSRFHRAHQYHFSTTTLSLLGSRLGLKTVSTFTSKDGGNAMIAFQKAQPITKEPQVEDRSHAQRIRRHLQSHTWTKHLCSSYPYTRPVSRLWRRLCERRAIASQLPPRAMLERLAERSHPSSPSHRKNTNSQHLPVSANAKSIFRTAMGR